MKFTISQAELVKALNKIQGITERRSTMPILSHVLLEASENGLKLSATDLEVGVTSDCACEVNTDGSLAVASKQFFDIVRTLPNKDVAISLMENWWLHIQCGRTEYKIVGLNPVDFPSVSFDEDIEMASINGKTLNKMIDRTIFCTSQDETRQHLRGVYCEWEEEESMLKMAATDGHRLALAQEVIDSCPALPSVIVPRKAFSELRRILSDLDDATNVKIGFSEKRGQVIAGDTQLSIALIEGKFPNYSRVIPVNNEQILIVNKQEFISTLKRISILSKEQEYTVNITPREGSVTITSQNPDFGEAREDLEAAYNGSSFTACFNARYILDVFNLHDSEQVQIEMADEISPTLVRAVNSNSFLAVVMPMRQ